MKTILRLAAGSTLVLGLAAAYVGHLGEPRYTAHARIQLADGELDDTPATLVRSPELIRAAAARVLVDIPQAVATTGGAAHDGIASTIRNGVSVRRVDGSRLVDVAVTAPDAQLASAGANALGDTYVARANADVQRASIAELDRISRARTQQDGVVAGLEQQLRAARAAETARVAERPFIGSLNVELTAAHAGRLAREPLYRQVESAADPLTVPFIVQHPAVQSLTRQIASLEQQRTAILQRYGEKHPTSIDVTRAVDSLRALREDAARHVAEDVRDDYRRAAAREQVLQAELASASNAAAAAAVDPTLEERLAHERDAADSLAAREQTLRASVASSTSGARVLDRAVPPEAPDSVALEWMWPLLFTSALLFVAAALFDFRHLFWPAVVHAATARHAVQFVAVPRRRATGTPRPVRQTAPEVLDREAVARLLAPDPEQPIVRKSA